MCQQIIQADHTCVITSDNHSVCWGENLLESLETALAQIVEQESLVVVQLTKKQHVLFQFLMTLQPRKSEESCYWDENYTMAKQ